MTSRRWRIKSQDRCFYNMFCKVSFENDVTQHGIKHVGTADGGKGAELNMQDGRNGNGVGGGMNGRGTDSSEETGIDWHDACCWRFD